MPKVKSYISERESELPGATIVKLLKIAEENPEIISLGPGEPDFEPHPSIIEKAKEMLDRGYTHYSPSQGRSELLEALCRKLEKKNGINVSPEQIIVTCGSQEAIFLGLMATIDPGEHVLIPDPGFLAYRPCVELLNGSPVPVKLEFENGFRFTAEGVRRSIVNPRRTIVLIINTPSNPTGTVFDRKTLEEIADVVVEHDILVFSDEAYEDFVYRGRHVSFASLNGMEERTVTFHTFSKAYGMPGFRIGYASGPEEIIKAMVKIHPYTTLCSPTVSQVAALAALELGDDEVRKIVERYDRRRKYLYREISSIDGFECHEPEGAFYLFPKIDFGMKSLEFCEFLLKRGVACVPGTEFGHHGEGFVRFSYATRMELIEKAVERIEKAVAELSR
ncbi:MAG: pyridoxal phosphate-dependent aminotransferase [Candidatus Micrarchaeota archaeon]|nr:pyridoxal phosphate-dependent aminotransferase [Candidatus Micrarchaeota archaeon]